MSMLQSGNEQFSSFVSIEEALAHFNSLLLAAADKANVPIAPISIDGLSGHSDKEKIAAIKTQFDGLMQRLTIANQQLSG